MTLLTLLSIMAMSRVTGDGKAGPIRVYSKNLWHGNAKVAALAADITDATPDIVFLQEVSETNGDLLSVLRSQLSYQARCPWQGWNGMAILSRWPLSRDTTRCSPERSLMAVRVMKADGPFWAVGVHLQQPWPDVQWEHLESAFPTLSGIEDGAVVAGDFNTVPWSAAARKIGQLTNTKVVPPELTTFNLWGVGLPLDQVWTLGGKARLRPLLGSDHHGVVAEVWPSKI
ncbi:endonuclease/exonuclease/phosphatase family protein [Yoonia sp. 2307UL14-13]|uniref:endonuclease/exonuclease/phosphatase family protein n=1 Tax=Yoonia sp. 2307UL14-13 TaxID=3126506 RepID=UPI0030ACA977